MTYDEVNRVYQRLVRAYRERRWTLVRALEVEFQDALRRYLEARR